MHKRFGRWQVGGVLAVVVAGAGVWAGASLNGVRADATAPSDLEQSFKKAQVDGKYDMLLRQIKVEKDAENYGDFKDYGFSNTPEYADQKDLPAGYWVYVAPYWYIWRDLTAVASRRPKRNWGPEQATGEPDTTMAGDIVTAWASASQDGQEEWLMLEYGEFVAPTAVLVHETFNPGALYRVTAFRPDGEEVELWKGADPTPTHIRHGRIGDPRSHRFQDQPHQNLPRQSERPRLERDRRRGPARQVEEDALGRRRRRQHHLRPALPGRRGQRAGGGRNRHGRRGSRPQRNASAAWKTRCASSRKPSRS